MRTRRSKDISKESHNDDALTSRKNVGSESSEGFQCAPVLEDRPGRIKSFFLPTELNCADLNNSVRDHLQIFSFDDVAMLSFV